MKHIQFQIPVELLIWESNGIRPMKSILFKESNYFLVLNSFMVKSMPLIHLKDQSPKKFSRVNRPLDRDYYCLHPKFIQGISLVLILRLFLS